MIDSLDDEVDKLRGAYEAAINTRDAAWSVYSDAYEAADWGARDVALANLIEANAAIDVASNAYADGLRALNMAWDAYVDAFDATLSECADESKAHLAARAAHADAWRAAKAALA